MKKRVRPFCEGQQTHKSNDNIFVKANKSVYEKIFNALNKRCHKNGNKMVSLPDVFLCLSWMRICKKDGYIILYEMQKLGMVELKPYHGLILNHRGAP